MADIALVVPLPLLRLLSPPGTAAALKHQAMVMLELGTRSIWDGEDTAIHHRVRYQDRCMYTIRVEAGKSMR